MDERSSLGALSTRGCFFRNERARNTHVEDNLNHPFPAQAVAGALFGDSPDGRVRDPAALRRALAAAPRDAVFVESRSFPAGGAPLRAGPVDARRRPPLPLDLADLAAQLRPVWNSNLQPDFNVRVFECFDTSTSAVLRELAESNRFVQTSAESTSI